MIVDSSAVVAILIGEPGHQRALQALEQAETAKIGAPTVLESAMVLTGKMGLTGRSLLSRFVEVAGLSVTPFTAEHWPLATDAFVQYGKGRHPAALNFGDCLTYAVSKLADEPLLCVGNDFTKTDLELVLKI